MFGRRRPDYSVWRSSSLPGPAPQQCHQTEPHVLPPPLGFICSGPPAVPLPPVPGHFPSTSPSTSAMVRLCWERCLLRDRSETKQTSQVMTIIKEEINITRRNSPGRPNDSKVQTPSETSEMDCRERTEVPRKNGAGQAVCGLMVPGSYGHVMNRIRTKHQSA